MEHRNWYKISGAVKGFKFYITGHLTNLDLLLWMVEAKEVIERKGRRNNEARICKNRLDWLGSTHFMLINRLIIEDDSNFCSIGWFHTVRFDQFIAFMARYAFFSLFSMLKVRKNAYYRKHLEVFFSIQIQSRQTANYSTLLKNISACPNCSSVGFLKCVQFHNRFRLH